MFFTEDFLDDILTDIITYFDRCYLVNDPLNLVDIDEAISSHTSKVIGTYLPVAWSVVSSQSSHTTNSPSSNPFNWSVASGEQPNKILLVNATDGVIVSIINTGKAEYTVNNAYYLDYITEGISEV